MIELTNKTPYRENGNLFDVELDGEKIATLVISESDTTSHTWKTIIHGVNGERAYGLHAKGEPATWETDVYDADGKDVIIGLHIEGMPSTEELEECIGHVLNIATAGVHSASPVDPDGYQYLIVWREVEVPGTRSVIWGEPYDPTIRWEVANNARWYPYPDMSDDSVGDIAAREVERGAILEPGDFYVWQSPQL